MDRRCPRFSSNGLLGRCSCLPIWQNRAFDTSVQQIWAHIDGNYALEETTVYLLLGEGLLKTREAWHLGKMSRC